MNEGMSNLDEYLRKEQEEKDKI